MKPIKLIANKLKDEDGNCYYEDNTIEIDLKLKSNKSIFITLVHECYHIAKHNAKIRGLLGNGREEWIADKIGNIAWSLILGKMYLKEGLMKETLVRGTIGRRLKRIEAKKPIKTKGPKRVCSAVG